MFIITVNNKFLSYAGHTVGEYPDAAVFTYFQDAQRCAMRQAQLTTLPVKVIADYGMDNQRELWSNE